MLGNAKHPRAIIALCVITVVAIAAVAVFESSGGFAATQVTTNAQIESDYYSHLDNVHSMNVTAIEQDYSKDASVQFTDPNENTGNFTGQASIGKAYNAMMFENFALPIFTGTSANVTISGNKATLESSFLVQGYNIDGNALTATVETHVTYVRQGSDWLISYELWNFHFQALPADDEGDEG